MLINTLPLGILVQMIGVFKQCFSIDQCRATLQYAKEIIKFEIMLHVPLLGKVMDTPLPVPTEQGAKQHEVMNAATLFRNLQEKGGLCMTSNYSEEPDLGFSHENAAMAYVQIFDCPLCRTSYWLYLFRRQGMHQHFCTGNLMAKLFVLLRLWYGSKSKAFWTSGPCFVKQSKCTFPLNLHHLLHLVNYKWWLIQIASL